MSVRVSRDVMMKAAARARLAEDSGQPLEIEACPALSNEIADSLPEEELTQGQQLIWNHIDGIQSSGETDQLSVLLAESEVFRTEYKNAIEIHCGLLDFFHNGDRAIS